ncbi:hypothetical protein AYO20_10941 [Fonsecaea nubica]|uniref:Uncharacterized protein n=1 Tax=Fonsecaea nubica TaxID=856822 RepID=A0A178C4J7_9EURO|nr:hypothetical protein AYO20_10941 [Fonsecaea nubica]OAL23691.1 hypothetical protein AYO20_10941 [Fonsecaea nubica]
MSTVSEDLKTREQIVFTKGAVERALDALLSTNWKEIMTKIYMVERKMKEKEEERGRKEREREEEQHQEKERQADEELGVSKEESGVSRHDVEEIIRHVKDQLTEIRGAPSVQMKHIPQDIQGLRDEVEEELKTKRLDKEEKAEERDGAGGLVGKARRRRELERMGDV